MGRIPSGLPRRAALELQLEGAVQILLAGLVFAVAAASSNVRYLNLPIGRALRWWVLAELCAVAVLYALARRSRPSGLSPPLLLAAGFGALALVSAAWSAAPRLTTERGVSLGVLLVTAAALAYATAGRARAVGQLLLGLLGGATIVALLGLVHLAFSPEQAAVPATIQQPVRYNGLGANPNTMALLLAIALPLVLWAAWEVRTRTARMLVFANLALFVGSIVASGSRGAIAGAVLGSVVFVVLASSELRRAIPLVGAIVAVSAASLAVLAVLPTAERNTRVQIEEFITTPPEGAERVLPLNNEIGVPEDPSAKPQRTLFASGARITAWGGALEQVAERPVAGYGFGTEERVFVDRYYLFLSDRIENSYIATALQLGLVGLAFLLAVVGAVAWGARRLRSQPPELRLVGAAAAGTTAAALVLGGTQSYLTSAGSAGGPMFWLCLFAVAAAAAGSRGPRAHAGGELEQRQRDERKQNAPQRHREPRLDVVGREQRGVDR